MGKICCFVFKTLQLWHVCLFFQKMEVEMMAIYTFVCQFNVNASELYRKASIHLNLVI